jgi:hypothetical protein
MFHERVPELSGRNSHVMACWPNVRTTASFDTLVGRGSKVSFVFDSVF